MTTSTAPSAERRYDANLSMTVLAVIYAILSAGAALFVGLGVSAELGILTFLLALVLGLVLAGATATVTMALLDVRRASVSTS